MPEPTTNGIACRTPHCCHRPRTTDHVSSNQNPRKPRMNITTHQKPTDAPASSKFKVRRSRFEVRPSIILAALLALSTINPQLSTFAQGSAFTWQGRLADHSTNASGFYDLTFVLYDAATKGTAPYALTCLDEYFLSLQEQLFLRLAPARGFGQSIGDLPPVLEHLLEGKPRSYGLEYLAKGKSKFPPAARVPRLLASSIPRGKVRAPGPEPCRSITPRIACRRARLWRCPGPAWAGGRVERSA
jgi:hypothetical protein